MSDHYHMRRRRYDSSGSDDFDDEKLDPRIQVELEKLNKASEEINQLELELDDARASFRQTLSESTQKLDLLAKKLGSSVEKARPYYEARVKARDAHLETQRAALRFERACSMHEAAKEMVQLAEQGYMRREQPSDPAWQEMLNHATMKVNEAEKERNESELEHQRTTLRFKAAEEQVQHLQKELKRAIAKSKPYFEMKAGFNQKMEEHKCRVGRLEEQVASVKSLYSSALRSLEAISDDIHRQRLERRQQQMLGVRGSGVGAECPFPPPSWEKTHSIDGSDSVHTSSCQILDPLGVIKIPVVSYQGVGFKRMSLTGGSLGVVKDHVDIVEDDQSQNVKRLPSPAKTGELVPGTLKEQNSAGLRGDNTLNTETYIEGEFVGGDPLGVLPTGYAGSGLILHVGPVPAHSISRQGTNISHPAFSGLSRNSRATTVTSVTHPMVSHVVTSGGASQTKPPAVIRSASVGTSSEFVLPSLIFNNPEKARRQSYRKAVEASQKNPQEGDFQDRSAESWQEEELMSLPRRHTQHEMEISKEGLYRGPTAFDGRSSAEFYSNPPHQFVGQAAEVACPVSVRVAAFVPEEPVTGHQQTLSSENLVAVTTQSGTSISSDNSPVGGSPSCTQRSQKLQGLILRIDPAMDPLRFQPPPQKVISPLSASKIQDKPIKTSGDVNQMFSPNYSADSTPREVLSPDSFADFRSGTFSKSMIRSASLASAVGSEPSEADLSEIDSVSATQSPTKPRSRLLNVPASMETVEDSSDTESLASTGPMLDDEQVEFLNKDFSEVLSRELEKEESSLEARPFAKRNNWSRMSLPPRLSYLENYFVRSKVLSSDRNYSAPGVEEIQTDENVHAKSPTWDRSLPQESSDQVVDSVTEIAEDSKEDRDGVINIHL